MRSIWQSTYRNRSWSNNCLILCTLFLIICLILNEKFNIKTPHFNQLNHAELMIDRIRDISINQTFVPDKPNWIFQYKISHLFNFYWLETDGYQWHLQQMIDLEHLSTNRQTNGFNQTYLFDYLNHHPESGVIIDTASDPFQSIFSPLPGASSSLKEICIRLEIFHHWYPCYTRSEMISLPIIKPLFTYGLYDVTINNSSSSIIIHYDEMIYLFDNTLETMNETFFIRQILPRFIRLLALVPQTAVILSPYFYSEIKYVNQYIDLLIYRGILNDKKRLIQYSPKKTYHAYVVYSTSSPRADIILLQQILIDNRLSIRPELILIIRNNLNNSSYVDIIQTINLFEFPQHFNYLRIQDYTETSYSIKRISQLFHQALIVIGVSSDILSHIVWCLPGTHIIEIGQKTMTTDYYEISLQLKFHYWLALSIENNQIDLVDFRNLIMKIFTYLNDRKN